MTNPKDAPEVEKTSGGQVSVKVKDLESDQDDDTYEPREDESDAPRPEDTPTTSGDLDKGKSDTLLDEEEDALVDTLSHLHITKKSGRKSLSESSLDSDGDVSGCDSDLDSDGLTGSEEQNLRIGRSSNIEGLVERGALRHGSNCRRHDKPYERPSPDTPKRAACRQSDNSNSGGHLITPEDDDMLKNLIEDIPDLSSVTDFRSPACSGSSSQSPTSSGSPYQDLVPSVPPIDDEESLMDDLLKSLDDLAHSNNVNGATKHHQVTSELPLNNPNQSLFFSSNQFNSPGSFADDAISATSAPMQTSRNLFTSNTVTSSSPFQATQQPYQNDGATSTPFIPPIHSAASSQYPPNSVILPTPQLGDTMPVSLTNPSQLGSVPVVADEANCFGGSVSEPSIPTVVAEKMNEPDPQKKTRRKRMSRKKDSQRESRPTATCVTGQNSPASSGTVGIQNLPTATCVTGQNNPASSRTVGIQDFTVVPLPSVASADEQMLKEALEYIKEEVSGSYGSPVNNLPSTTIDPMWSSAFPGHTTAPVQQLPFNQPQLGSVPQQHPVHHNGPAPVFNSQIVPGSQMQTSQNKAYANPGPSFTLHPPNGTHGNPILPQTYCSNPSFTTPMFTNGLGLRQLKPNSAQYKFICAGSYGAPSQPYFAFPFQPVQPVQPVQPTNPVILVSPPERGQTDRFIPIQPRLT